MIVLNYIANKISLLGKWVHFISLIMFDQFMGIYYMYFYLHGLVLIMACVLVCTFLVLFRLCGPKHFSF